VTCADERYLEPEVHDAAAALRAAGVFADVVSWDEDRNWGAYELVVVRTPWDYFDRLPEFLGWAAQVERQTALVNPADVLRWNSHKGYLAEFTAKGVPTVPTLMVPGPSTDVADQIREVPWQEIVVKPAVDGGARHAWRGRRDDPALTRVAEVDHQPNSAELRVALSAMEAAPGRLSYARVDLVNWQDAPALIELEVIEPDLFFRGVPERMDRFVEVVQEELAAARAPT